MVPGVSAFLYSLQWILIKKLPRDFCFVILLSSSAVARLLYPPLKQSLMTLLPPTFHELVQYHSFSRALRKVRGLLYVHTMQSRVLV